jgi:glycosyltransferase involved in cell wall biosynthesis
MMTGKKNHVVIITQYFPPDISGGATRAFNYSKCLEQQNYDVTVITAHPHQHGPVTGKYKHKIILKEKMDGMNIIRVWVPSLLHSSVLKSAILNTSFLISSMFPIFSVKPDIIFAFEPNLFSIIPSFFYSKLRGGKVIRAIDDLWPEYLYERGIFSSRIIRFFLNRLAKFSYVFPEYLIPLNNAVKKIIHESYKIDNKKFEVLSHGIDTKKFTYSKKTRNNIFTLMYFGSLVESYDFDIIIDAAKKLKGENIQFIIRGRGKLLQNIKNQKEKYELNNLLIETDIVKDEEISKTLHKSDVLLAPMQKSKLVNYSLPTKILEYQAVGRPIICCSDGAIGTYVEQTNSGLRANQGNVESFVNSILKLESDSKLCDLLGENGRKNIEKYNTFEKIGIRLSLIIDKVITEK